MALTTSSPMTTLRLYKREKLCSHNAINALFSHGESKVATAFPIRAVWRINEQRSLHNAQFLISVPKRRFKHAVDRVLLRRRTREAYRLNRNHLTLPNGIAIDIAFIYIAPIAQKYGDIERAMIKILHKISDELSSINMPK